MFTQEALETKSGPELVAIFNGLDNVSPVKRFRNREAGVRRILAFTTYDQAEEVTMNPTPAEALIALDVQLEEDEIALGRTPKVRGVYNLERKDLIRTFRVNSRRGRLINLLLADGATFDQLLVQSDFNEEDVLHKTIRILNWWTGYGITTDDAGIITLTS